MAKTAAKKGKAQTTRVKTVVKGTAAKEAKAGAKPAAKPKPGAASKADFAERPGKASKAEFLDDEESGKASAEGSDGPESADAEDSDEDDMPVMKGRAGNREKLIELGKAKGYLTYDEVNNMMPVDIVSSDQIDDWLSALGDEGIEIVDSASQFK